MGELGLTLLAMSEGKHRPAFERIKIAWAFIRAGYHPNMSDLAAVFECSTKAVQRDLDFMRDRMELQFEYNAAWHGYELTGKPVCCFCCEASQFTQRYPLERKPEPLVVEVVRKARPGRFSQFERVRRAQILAEARKIANNRRTKKRYHAMKNGAL